MIQIVVNADDFGMNDEVNEAIVYCFEHGLISNTTIMPNMPGAEKAIALAKQRRFFDRVGLHLNLREGIPMTEQIRSSPAFCDENGSFQMHILPLVRYFFPIQFLSREFQKSLESELRAQMKWYISAGFTEMHMDSHQSVHTWFLFLSAIKPMFKSYSFKSMRLRVSGFRENVSQKLYRAFINRQICCPVSAMYDIAAFVEHRDELRDNVCYEVMCHPIMRNGCPVDSLSGVPIEEITKCDNIRLVSYSEL